ncbi:MAG: DUF4381 domain-containing protein [Pseudomonas sp.]
MSTPSPPDISQLQVLPLPAPLVSYWPQTWGWAVLALVLVLAAGWWALRYWQRWARNRYRREALAALAVITAAVGQPEQRLAALRTVPPLLKRVALSMPDAPPVARLGGSEWQAFLRERSSQPLPDGFATWLATLAYAPDAQVAAIPDAEVQALLATSRQWVEGHHVAV